MRILFILMGALILLLPAQADANGWGEQVPLQFKLMRPGANQTNESLRLAFDRDLGSGNGGGGSGAGGLGDSQYQTSENMNNVMMITETYEIVLNGDNNVVTTKGSVLNGDQLSGETNQNGTNTASANSSTTTNNYQDTGN